MQRTKVQVDQGVIDRWEAIKGMTATHNVTFDTADGPVTAHDVALMACSPVLSAMLTSCMAEGASKRIQVKDSSAAGVSLFLDLVYTSSTCSEAHHECAVEALDLAHRWQVASVVRVLEEILQGMITESSFVDIASSATSKGLLGLERACAAFAQNSKALRQMSEKGELPPALEKFLGHDATASDTSAPKKKRRTF
ncbi:KLHL26 [Symbiodinium sp. CCMP2456]|nr:KLHL26 [Symbiodinium sp. CCMP2456]